LQRLLQAIRMVTGSQVTSVNKGGGVAYPGQPIVTPRGPGS
ncbi:unnamed protein product, partial [marine sediment metagenome]